MSLTLASNTTFTAKNIGTSGGADVATFTAPADCFVRPYIELDGSLDNNAALYTVRFLRFQSDDSTFRGGDGFTVAKDAANFQKQIIEARAGIFVRSGEKLRVRIEGTLTAESGVGGTVIWLNALAADAQRWLNTDLPAPAAAGYPVTLHKVGPGTGELQSDTGRVPAILDASDVNGNLPIDATGILDAIAALGDLLALLQAAVNNLNNLSALANIFGPVMMEIPDSGSKAYKYTVMIKDESGHALDLDNDPTVAVANSNADDRSANISAIGQAAGGEYTFLYNLAADAPSESLTFRVSGTANDGADTRAVVFTSVAVDYDSISLLAAIYAKVENLPSSPAAVGSSMTLTSAYDAAKTAASATNLAAAKAVVDDNSTQLAALVGRLTSTRAAKLDNLDLAISQLLAGVGVGAVAAEPTPTTTGFTVTGNVSSAADAHVGQFLLFTSGDNNRIPRKITAQSGLALTTAAFPAAPAAADTFVVIGKGS